MNGFIFAPGQRFCRQQARGYRLSASHASTATSPSHKYFSTAARQWEQGAQKEPTSRPETDTPRSSFVCLYTESLGTASMPPTTLSSTIPSGRGIWRWWQYCYLDSTHAKSILQATGYAAQTPSSRRLPNITPIDAVEALS